MSDQTYSDDDFVYIDPDAKEVVGLVEWTKDGKPIAKERPDPEGEKGEDGKKRKRKKRMYPWGSFRTMNRIHKLKNVAQKEKEPETYIPLDEAIAKSNEEAFWD